MVNRLQLGKEAQNGLLLLGLTNTEAVNDLCQKLTQIQLSDLTEENIRNVVSATPSLSGLSSEEQELLSEAVMGLHYARASFDGDTESLAMDIVGSMRERPPENTQDTSLNEKFFACLLANLDLIFGVKTLGIKQKALTLAVFQERLFSSCRILTDIRPIFSDDDNEPTEISAAFVFHTLKISFIEDDESKYFYISLDANDLEELKSSVDRAVNKGNIAKRAISKMAELVNTENS